MGEARLTGGTDMLADIQMDPLTASAIERLAWTVGAVGVLIAVAVFYVGWQLRARSVRGRDDGPPE
jgi:hypothetical protein